jgi:hypothetical protein
MDTPCTGDYREHARPKDVNITSSPVRGNKVESGGRDGAAWLKGCMGLCRGYPDAECHEAVHHLRRAEILIDLS